MNTENLHTVSSERDQIITRPISQFVRRVYTSQINIDPEHVRAYVGLNLMLRDDNNPYFFRGQETALTGLEPYLIGRTSDPLIVAEEIGTYGYRAFKSLELQNGPYVIPRIKRLIITGRISSDTEERTKDLHILSEADMAIGNIVRKLQASMTTEGESFRAETHKAIGDPIRRFVYSFESHSESLVLPQSKPKIRPTGILRQPLDEVLRKLPIHLQKGYRFFSDLVSPTLSAPVERAFLISLRTR